MRLDWAILANAAEQSGAGTVSILGGGWDSCWRPSFPTPFIGALTLRTLFHPTEAGRVWTLRIEFHDEDGKAIAQPSSVSMNVVRPPELPVGWDVAAVASVSIIGLPIPKPGRYSIEILCEGEHKKTIPFRFLEGEGPTT